MPIYEYKCEDCRHTTEALRKMDEADHPIACEKCGSEKTSRAHSVFAAQVGSYGDCEVGDMGGCGGGCGGGDCPMG